MLRRILLPAFLLCTLVVAPLGCGSGGGSDETRGARRGSYVFALPFLPAASGETVVIGFKNATTTAAPVYVTPRMPDGTAYAAGTSALMVAGQGELRVSLAGLLGEAVVGGWIHVDTRDIGTLDGTTGEPRVIGTSGFVYPYIERDIFGAGIEEDSLAGLAPRSDEVRVTVTPYTSSVQLINYSVLEMAAGSVPLARTFEVDVVGSNGTTISSSVVPVAANSSLFVPFTPPFGAVGFVRVRPMIAAAAGELLRFSIAARESTLQVNAEWRFHETSDAHLPSILDVGFDVEFGADAGGSVHDFGTLLCNGSASTQSVALQAVYRRSGSVLLGTPRVFSLRPGRTVFLGTTDSLSFGLEGAETSWFSDIFGDVFSFGSFEAVTLLVQAPRDVDVSARHMDAGFGTFYRILPSIPRTNRACVFDLPIATSTSSGKRSWITITNTTSGELTVPVRAFTPARGTEYILPDIVVPPLARLDWSPDGIQLREEPTATVGPFVPYLRLDLTPNTGALFRGRVEARDAAGAVLYIRPTMLR
jgi:hypothetical protein